MAWCSNRGTGWALRPNKEKENEAYRDRSTDNDAPGGLSVRHTGRRRGVGGFTKKPKGVSNGKMDRTLLIRGEK